MNLRLSHFASVLAAGVLGLASPSLFAAAVSPQVNQNVYARPGQPGTRWIETRGAKLGLFAGQPARGVIEYSTNGGSTWLPVSTGSNSSATTAVSGNLVRYRDTNASDTTNGDTSAFFIVYDGNTTATHQIFVAPDNAPTDITASTAGVFTDAVNGGTVATLTPTDTGNNLYGVWAIDSQSVANLFTLSYDNTAGNTASLLRGTGTLPAPGSTVTVTVRYYDLFQTDDSGVPIPGDGFAKTLTFTVVTDATADLVGFSGEFSVNTTTAGAQNTPVIATLSSGNYVVVWRSVGQDADTSGGGGIYARRFSNTGTALSGELLISPADNVSQLAPAVSALSNDRFVVAYTDVSNANDVVFRIVAADNTLGTATSVDTTASLSQSNSRVATLSDGNFVVVWASNASNADIAARVFNGTTGATVGNQLTVNTTTTGIQATPDVAALASGNYVVVWRDANVSTTNVRGQRASSAGLAGSEFAAATSTTSQAGPRVAGFSDGTYVISWSGTNLEGDSSSENNIYFQRFTAAGAAAGSVTRANVGITGNQSASTIAAFGDGSFLIAWTSTVGDYDGAGIFGRRFTSAGAAVDPTDFLVNEKRHFIQTASAVTAGTVAGSFAATWVDGGQEGTAGVEARVFNPNTNTSPVITTPTSASIAATTATLGGNVTSDGGATVSERGIVYALTSQNNNPLINGTNVTKVTGTGTTGVFTAAVTGLTATSGYSYAAYATNSVGTTYTSVGTFTTDTPPNVSSINRVSANPTKATSLSYAVTFSESVTGVDTTDFTLTTTTGNAAGSISSISGSGTTYTITAGSITGDGGLRLDLKSSGTGITDASTSPISGGFTSGQVYTVDHTAPTVSSVVRQTPSGQTQANGTTTVTFLVTYSEAVTGVIAGNFQIENVNGGTVAGTVGTPTQGANATLWNVPVTLTGGSGEFRLKVIN